MATKKLTKDDVAKALLIAMSEPVSAALDALLDFDTEAGNVLPGPVRERLDAAAYVLMFIEDDLLDSKD